MAAAPQKQTITGKGDALLHSTILTKIKHPEQPLRQSSIPLLTAILLASAPVDAAKLEEIVVSAQKREQRLLDVPVSVSAFNQQQLTNHSASMLSNIDTMVPNFQAALPNGEILPIFSIRGVSMADYSVNQSGPVGVYVDEVYFSANYTHGIALFDLERVEVLRGPQGTLYGKNITGGAINLISKVPDFESDGFIKLGTGNYNQKSLDAAWETPLAADKLSARLALTAEQTDGYVKNHQPGKDDLSATDRHAARLTFNYVASNNLTALLRLTTGVSDPEAQAIIPEPTLNGIDILSARLAAAGEPFYQRPSNYDRHDVDANTVEKTEIHTNGGSLTLNWQFDKLQLSSITGIYHASFDQNADSDGTPQELLEIKYDTSMNQWSQELRINSQPHLKLTYTAGLYFSKEEIRTGVGYNYYHSLRDIEPDFVFPAAGIVSGFTQQQNYEQERESKAIYGELSYNLSEKLTLSTGLRFTSDKNSQFNVHTYIADYDGTPQLGLIPFNAIYAPSAVHPKQVFTDNEWTGTVKLSYNLNPNTLLYTSYNRGYRGGAFNGAAVNSTAELTSAKPEFVNAYELGIKGELKDGRIQYSSTAFYYDYHNQQFLNIVGAQQILHNASRSHIQGAELELRALATDDLTLQLGLGMLDTEYKKGLTLNAQGQSWDLSGNKLIAAPELNANLAADYRLQLDLVGIHIHADMNYIGEQWFSPFNDTANHDTIGQAGYTLFNSRIEFKPVNSAFTFALWGKNLGDKQYKTYAINLSDGFGYNYTMSGQPRTYGADVNLSF